MNSELVNPHMAFCLEGMNVSADKLIPITGEKYESFVSDLRRKVESNALSEQDAFVSRRSGREEAASHSSFRFADWGDVVESLENRIREAYLVEGSVCSGCGGDGNVVIAFRSCGGSWRRFCGLAGYMLICTGCMRQLKFIIYSRS